MTAAPPPEDGKPARPAVDYTGRTLGEFQLIRRLGRGGMADVYLAEQTSLHRQVAVKVLRPDFVSDPTYLKRFRHEAAAAGGLNHPNIVQVYSIVEHEGVHFIAQEYVPGGNLREYMKRNGPLDVPTAMRFMRQVAAALQVAGAAGIVHRDIKPENILLSKKGEAKVADFGLAQLTSQGEKIALTQVGVTMGTPLYMSPEQVSGKSLDHRSDVYSFGAMCYHMLAGKPPYQGDTALSVAVQHLNSTPAKLQERRADLPSGLCDLVQRMMAKDRDQRPADAQAVLNELKALTKQYAGKEKETAAQTRKRVSKRPTKLLDLPARRQLLRFAAAAVLVLAASAGIGWTMRLKDPFLTPAPPVSRQIPTEASIDAQYLWATLQGDDEAAWKSVVDYADPTGLGDELARQTAKVRLAIIYLKQQRLDEAEAIFQQFQRESSNNPWKSHHYLAGEAIIANYRGDARASQQYLDQLDRQSGAKLDRRLMEVLDEVRTRNERAKKAAGT